MKNSRVFYILLLALNFWGTSGTVQLDEFLKAVADARPELQWLEGDTVDSSRMKKRSASIGELLASFVADDDDDGHGLEGGDAWYQSFRAMECQHGGGRGCLKKPLRWTLKTAQPDDYYEYYDDAVDVKKSTDLKDQREETANDLSHEANYKLSKAEQDAAAERSLPNTAWSVHHNSKRRVDPMDAVKLKTSLRLLKNGDGPSLPSSFLPNSDKVMDEVKRNIHERRRGRRLLSVEDPDHESSLTQALDLDQFDNLKQKTPLDRQLGELMFDNAAVGHERHDNKNIFFGLNGGLTRTDAFVKLQNYLKENHNQSSGQRTTTAPLNLAEKDRDVNINLHMSVNATVMGEDKLPQGFRRNKTITFEPPAEMSRNPATIGDDLSRDRRRVVFPILPADPNDDISKSAIDATDQFPLDEVISGQLTSQLVKAVFELVKTSPTLKILWPGLMRNKLASPRDVPNFDVIRTHATETEMHRAEIMFRQAMEAINAIIDQQVRSRSCVPLRSDLEAFYTLIIKSQAENDRRQKRRKHESHDDMSDPEIRRKSKIVKKLLRDYEELPREDQQQVASVKKSLLVAVQQLREMQRQSKRRKRHIVELHLNDNHTASSAFETRYSDHVLSPEYTKLTKTAELLRLQNSLRDPDMPMGFSYI